ncbi:hypothetical protein D3C80_2238990 [compost metagenome]
MHPRFGSMLEELAALYDVSVLAKKTIRIGKRSAVHRSDFWFAMQWALFDGGIRIVSMAP